MTSPPIRLAAGVLAAVLVCGCGTPRTSSHKATAALASALKLDLQTYLTRRGTVEHISAASLTVSLRNRQTVDASAGTTTYGGSVPVTPSNLFQIGSNTKAFTAVLVLALQAQRKLALDQPIGRWLPQYPAWKAVTIRQLLNMTGGIETYDNVPAMERAYAANPRAFSTAAKLVNYVDRALPLHRGWRYSNTGYLLVQMAIEKAAGTSYADLLRSDVIAKTGIADLYYDAGIYPADIRARTVAGYYWNRSPDSQGLAPLLGRSVRDDSASWAQAAGGIVATPHALALWARDLYQGTILTPAQRAQMESLVSTKTGTPIAHVSASDPRGFGLGLVQVLHEHLGVFWFYEGETLGYRMVHCYFPKQDVVLAFGLNSQTAPNEDHAGDLVRSIVATLRSHGAF